MQNTLVLSVSQLNRYIKMNFDADENLANIFISGEISNFTNHYRTGHLYFTLKDDSAAVRAVMFNSSAKRLKFMPEDGMKVIARGRVSVYEASGQYQLYVDDMQPDGVGALNLAYEQLKEKLQKEGLFFRTSQKAAAAVPRKSRSYHFAYGRSRARYNKRPRQTLSLRRNSFLPRFGSGRRCPFAAYRCGQYV